MKVLVVVYIICLGWINFQNYCYFIDYCKI